MPNFELVAKNGAADSWTREYYHDLMVNAVKNGATQGQYFYDGDGLRVKLVEGNTKVYTFLWLGILYEKDVTAGTVTKSFYANGLLLARTGLAGTTYFHQDALGSTRLTTDGEKTIQLSSNHRPFGSQGAPQARRR